MIGRSIPIIEGIQRVMMLSSGFGRYSSFIWIDADVGDTVVGCGEEVAAAAVYDWDFTYSCQWIQRSTRK